MVTRKDNDRFNEHMNGEDMLERSIEWIADNLKPAEVFGEDEVIEFIRSSYEPEIVFPEEELEKWALSNGFKKEES